MPIEPGIELIAAELYAIGYEITAWIHFTAPDESYKRYRLPLVHDGEECELHITADYNSNISFELQPLMRVRGLNLSEPTPNQAVPIKRRWIILTKPKLNDRMPGISDPSYPSETFPANYVLTFLQGLKAHAVQYHT